MGDRLAWWARKSSLGDQSADSPTCVRRLQPKQQAADSKHQLSQQQANNIIRQTPRLPRGVTKIPHQVNLAGDHHDSLRQPSMIGLQVESANEADKYLTFSKEQASSHLRSLVQELSPTISQQESLKQQYSARPAPMEDDTCTSTTVCGYEQVENQSGRLQQPVCEAFIMTGQSMLKLSCNESSAGADTKRLAGNKTAPSLAAQRSAPQLTPPVDAERAKSASLGKLDEQGGRALASGGATSGNQLAAHLEPVAQPRVSQRASCTSGELSAGGTPADECCRNGSAHGRQVAATDAGASSETMLESSAAAALSSQAERGRLGSEAQSRLHNVVPDDRGRRIEEATTATSNLVLSPPPPSRTADHRSCNSTDVDPQSQTITGDQVQTIRGDQVQTIRDDRMNTIRDDQVQTSGNSACNQATEQQQPDMEEPATTPDRSQAMAALACNERESARRLAKRLYNLSGFKRTDVSHHLAKQNPFSELVAEEYLNLFDFRGQRLDGALRKFLSKSQLNGETQERERTLSRFSNRFYQCNQDKYPSPAAVQMLVCALILLNTDLHGPQAKQQKRHTKLSLGAFVDGLNSSLEAEAAATGKPAGSFARHQLVDLYESIKKRPLKCATNPEDKCDMSSLEAELDRIYKQQVSGGSSRWNTLPSRRHAAGSNLASSNTLGAGQRRQLKQSLSKLNGSACNQQSMLDQQEPAIEFKCGYLTRKRIFDPAGKPTGKGRRSWRRVRASLNDLNLCLPLVGKPSKEVEPAEVEKPSDAKDYEANGNLKTTPRGHKVAQDLRNTLKVHHGFAKPSASYTKRAHVFHLRLANQAELLLQADSEQEMLAWIDTINFAAACLSSPALPVAISNGHSNRSPTSSPAKHILPASYTRLSYWEQLIDHEEHLQRLKSDLDDHLSHASATKNATKRGKTEFIERIAYLKQEIERYSIYVDLMRKKSNSPEAIILSKHPQIASLTPSQEMILSLPGFAPPSPESPTPTDAAQSQQSNQTTNQAAQISVPA